MPFEDISKDLNGVNLEIPRKIAQALEKQGLTVVYPDALVPFLAKNRYRWMGWVDQVTALKIAKQFNVDLIMLGTVTELNKSEPPCIGLIVQLLKVKDYKLIWSRSAVFSAKEEISILGLDKPTFQSLEMKTINTLVANIPPEIQQKAIHPPVIEITDVFLKPKRVQSHTEVECAIRLNTAGPSPSEILFQINGKEIPARPQTQKEGLYIAKWIAPEKEGRYPIKLVVKWDKYSLHQEMFLTSLIVDNTPPKFSLKIIRGEKIKDSIAFNRHILLVPIFEQSEPIARWAFYVLDPKTRTPVFKVERPGRIPSRLIWRGTNIAGKYLANGQYIAKVKVWDQAGNSYEQETKLLFVKSAPAAKILAEKLSDKKVKLIIKVNKHLLPLTSWRLELWDSDGNLISEYESTKEKDEVSLPNDENLLYTLEIRDILGNKTILKNIPLKPLILRAATTPQEKEKTFTNSWTSDF